MISVWAKFVPAAHNHTANGRAWLPLPPFDKAHGGPDGNSEQYYDAFNPDARALYWRQIDERLFSKGVDGLVARRQEPEIGDLKRDEARSDGAHGPVHGARQLMPIADDDRGGVSRPAPSDRPSAVFILTRSAFAGSSATRPPPGRAT